MDIQKTLSELGISDNNNGVMIGSRSFGSGASFDSVSPTMENALLALPLPKEDYEEAIKVSSEALLSGVSGALRRGGGSLFGRLLG